MLSVAKYIQTVSLRMSNDVNHIHRSYLSIISNGFVLIPLAFAKEATRTILGVLGA